MQHFGKDLGCFSWVKHKPRRPVRARRRMHQRKARPCLWLQAEAGAWAAKRDSYAAEGSSAASKAADVRTQADAAHAELSTTLQQLDEAKGHLAAVNR